jgi:hypothetical protein
MMMGNPQRRFLSLIFLVLSGFLELYAQESSAEQGVGQESVQVDERAVLILWSQKSDAGLGSHADQFMAYLIQSLRSALSLAQYPTVDTVGLASLPEIPMERALGYGRERRVRWVFVAHVALSGQSLSWAITAYDALRGSLRASDSFSTFPGLSALPSLDDSCRSVVQAWLGAIAADRDLVHLAEETQTFYGRQDGVQVWYGSAESGALAGTIAQGKLDGVYFPFPLGQPLQVEAVQEGFWPRTLVLPQGITNRPVQIPPLQKKSVHVWGFGTGTGKLLGATYLYRYYPLPDRFFLRFDNSLWAGYSFLPGAVPLWHDELRFGMGLYLQNKVDAGLRIVMGTGGSGVISYLPGTDGGKARSALDILLDPIWLCLEYHFPRWALTAEFRMPYASGSGFLNQGWLESSGGGPFVTIGVLFK